jgi:hypothetical protein
MEKAKEYNSLKKKLFLIRGEVQKHDKIKAAGRNEFHKFDYLTPSQVLDIVNPLLEKYSLLVEFNIVDVKSFPTKTSTSKTETKEGVSATTKTEADNFDFLAVVEVVITDVEDIENEDFNYKLNLNIPLDKFSPQGYGAILTYVERYFYTKTFGIAQNEDDPDTKEQKRKTERPRI